MYKGALLLLYYMGIINISVNSRHM